MPRARLFLSRAAVDEVHEVYRATRSARAAGLLLGCSEATVRNTLRRAGFKVQRRGRVDPKATL